MPIIAAGRKVAVVIAALIVGWWLFADTYARHAATASVDKSIRFAHFGTYQDYELWRGVIAEFEREYPESRIRQEYVVGLADRYNTKMRQQVLSHRLPDVALIQLGPFRDLAQHFADLSGVLEDAPSHGTNPISGLDAVGLVAFRADGIQRGLPLSGGNLLIYCNLDCFQRASQFRGSAVPLPSENWTMEDFHRTAKALTCDFDGDGVIDQFGFWLPRWVYYLPFIWSFGADLTDESLLEWKLHGANAEQALEFYRELAVGDRVCPRDDEVPQLFQDVGFLTGKVGMCVNGPWFQPFLDKAWGKRNPAHQRDGPSGDSYYVANIPRGPAGRTTRVTWDGIVMAKNLPPARREIAKRFIRHMLSKPVQDRIARTGKALPALADSAGAFVDPADNLQRRRFVDALRYSRIQPALPRFAEVDRAINRHLYHLLDPSRITSPAAVLDQLASDPAVKAAFAPSVASDP